MNRAQALIKAGIAGVLVFWASTAFAEQMPSKDQLAIVKDSLGRFMPNAETVDLVIKHQSGDPGKRTFAVCGFGVTADQRLPFYAMIVEDGQATNAQVTAYGFNDRFKSMVYDECAAKGAPLPTE